jgi:hypothetical protein
LRQLRNWLRLRRELESEPVMVCIWDLRSAYSSIGVSLGWEVMLAVSNSCTFSGLLSVRCLRWRTGSSLSLFFILMSSLGRGVDFLGTA